MKLDSGRFAVAVATVFTVAGAFCALLFKLAPDAYYRSANFLLHSGMYQATRPVGWGELFLALATWWVIVAVVSGASAALYNKLLAGSSVAAARRAA